jgi:hypothetical protein
VLLSLAAHSLKGRHRVNPELRAKTPGGTAAMIVFEALLTQVDRWVVGIHGLAHGAISHSG